MMRVGLLLARMGHFAPHQRCRCWRCSSHRYWSFCEGLRCKPGELLYYSS
ncbi:hypothetical protein LINGRAHAP2_LOCUS11260 [Linum grandiflorum]